MRIDVSTKQHFTIQRKKGETFRQYRSASEQADTQDMKKCCATSLTALSPVHFHKMFAKIQSTGSNEFAHFNFADETLV